MSEIYITCNLFIWEVLHVYHKKGLAVGTVRASDSLRVRPETLVASLAVYNLTPKCVT